MPHKGFTHEIQDEIELAGGLAAFLFQRLSPRHYVESRTTAATLIVNSDQ
jgi:hypothetical protein